MSRFEKMGSMTGDYGDKMAFEIVDVIKSTIMIFTIASVIIIWYYLHKQL
jgi:hypothetical protein